MTPCAAPAAAEGDGGVPGACGEVGVDGDCYGFGDADCQGCAELGGVGACLEVAGGAGQVEFAGDVEGAAAGVGDRGDQRSCAVGCSACCQ